MAEYNNEKVNAVENMQYCVPSMQKRNVDSMTQMSGYHDMSDRANTGKWPTMMEGAKINKQPMGSAGNYRKA